jgi:hypothetical protein
MIAIWAHAVMQPLGAGVAAGSLTRLRAWACVPNVVCLPDFFSDFGAGEK